MDNTLTMQCKNCGAAVGYDIERQIYRCPSCGASVMFEAGEESLSAFR